MLEQSEMKKMHMILANIKNSIPINSRCLIINNKFVQTGDGTFECSQDDKKHYIPRHTICCISKMVDSK